MTDKLRRTIARGPRDPSLQDEAEARYIERLRQERREFEEMMARIDGRRPPLPRSKEWEAEADAMMRRLDGRSDPIWKLGRD